MVWASLFVGVGVWRYLENSIGKPAPFFLPYVAKRKAMKAKILIRNHLLKYTLMLLIVCLNVFSNTVKAQIITKNGEWRDYEFDYFSISIPPTLELRTDSDTYTLVVDSISKAHPELGTNVKHDVIFQQRGLSTNQHRFKNNYCRILIDYYQSSEQLPFSNDPYRFLHFDSTYFDAQKEDIIIECENENIPVIQILSYDTLTIGQSPATEIHYLREGVNGNPPVLVAVYYVFNYKEYVRIIISFRNNEAGIWENDMAKVLRSFSWNNLYSSPFVSEQPTDNEERLSGGALFTILLTFICGVCFIIVILRADGKSARKCRKTSQAYNADLIKQLGIDLNDNSEDEITITTEEENRIIRKHKQGKFKQFLKRIVLTFFILLVCIGIPSCLLSYGYGMSLIYFTYYVILGFHYLYLTWRKKGVQGEDVFLYPLLKKIRLLKNETNKYIVRKILLKTVIPLLVVTLLTPLLVLLMGEPNYDEGETKQAVGELFLCIPLILWIVFFIYAYGRKWINDVKR